MVNLDGLPGIAEPARLKSRAGKPFKYLEQGVMATISPGDAVADIKGA
ncbi:hypothetical protein [Lentzea sp. NPDC051838]